MSAEASEDAIDVALKVAAALTVVGAEYFLGGSLASSLQGEPRATFRRGPNVWSLVNCSRRPEPHAVRNYRNGRLASRREPSRLSGCVLVERCTATFNAMYSRSCTRLGAAMIKVLSYGAVGYRRFPTPNPSSRVV